jgi:hypothetical protein
MSTVSRELPASPHLAIPKRQARDLHRAWQARDPDAFGRIRGRHPAFADATDAALAVAPFKLADAQLVLAREYGSASWPELKHRIESHAVLGRLRAAIHADDCPEVVRLLRAHPHLLHVPVWSGNWGPPMSHAANLGRLAIVQAVSALGARDHAHAFDRALLQGRLECARWLHAQGAPLAPGIVMGPCETLNADGLRLLAELGAPFTDARGSALAPLALVLGTYCRRPAGKHAALALLAARGLTLPDTPMMAFHRGDAARLREFLRHDPTLLGRPWSLAEIYPPALGCAPAGGLHGTPLAGATFLHLAVDFEEAELFALLLDLGADPNVRAAVDADGFGGHTPLYHALVACGRPCSPEFARLLLARGTRTDVRASLRKFLDWRDTPGWHVARDVTPAAWARGFPEQAWVNPAAVDLLG